jgi:hypothetical protein
VNSPSDWAALIAALEVSGLVIFQLLLAMGFPLGGAAFGGKDVILPIRLRAVSAVSALIFLAAFYVILAHTGLFGSANETSLIHVGIWIFVGIFALSTLANAASRSCWERFLMAPVALILTVSCVVVALTS